MTHSPQHLLEVRGLTKAYGAMKATNDLSFHVDRGEVLGIGGPNGAGKTTLFDLLSGVTPPTAGRILFEGADITGLGASAICHLGISRTFQLNAVFNSQTVADNLKTCAYFGSEKRLVPGLSYDRRSEIRAAEVLDLTGLTDYADVMAGALPVLQLKLLMIGCAIVSHPKLLLLDEPVGGLNPAEIETCAAVFRQLRDFRGTTIVVIEHVMSFMTAFADRIMILHHGAKLHEGTAGSLADNPEVVDVFLGVSGAADSRRGAQAEEVGNAAS
ncbi:high-affinity branched-chain amino acid transport ATP-binding protein LivF (plasmid) [Pseudosulfitobacter pseudonitzschiae]|uniref:High-affinity branched-chain amino acid transport ATP-binding protein LivF n=1 Tax=Pseudosulfitobacter pseudonitzschiae TaxID=1402135 RepID=A0A221K9H5_9RHOB|nr:ABC transporter ATP-binding protein [Pseudosulfitobacter pseudonitzschiae]ASM75646.1 high-affinity branched-chain amino acid transport ATP-binding protein LivF [Pseudosulfitobacter pseudonitzschiae]